MSRIVHGYNNLTHVYVVVYILYAFPNAALVLGGHYAEGHTRQIHGLCTCTCHTCFVCMHFE